MLGKHKELTEKIIKCFYIVYNCLGYGFLEKVYANAMTIELQKAGLRVEQEAAIQVCYQGQIVGKYFPNNVFIRVHP